MSSTVSQPAPAVATSHVRRALAFYVALALLTLALGFARFDLDTGAWYHTYHPPEVQLLEGWPASWEVVYYTDQFPNFLGNAPPRFGIAPVHYRTYLTLYLTTVLYAVTGSAYWSFVAVDLFFWWLAGVATYHLARRLRASPTAAALGALLVIASPVLISHMWREDLHPANFASMPLGAWAAVTLMQQEGRAWRLSVALGFLLVLLSLSYQYQWVMVPVTLILLAGSRRITLANVLRAGSVIAGAVALYVLCTAGIQSLFDHGVGPPTEWNYVASQPGSMIAERLLRVRSVADALALLPNRYYQEELVRSYHPAVLIAGLIGVAMLGRSVALATVAGLVISLVSLTYYSAPWAATNVYPFVYVGTGVTCAALGSIATRTLRRVPGLAQARLYGSPAARIVGIGIAATVAFILAAQTNLDLVGNTTFLLTWWRYFGGRYLF